MKTPLTIALMVLLALAATRTARAELRASGVPAPAVERCVDVRFSFAPDDVAPATTNQDATTTTAGASDADSLASVPVVVAPPPRIDLSALSSHPLRACTSYDDPGCQARAPRHAPASWSLGVSEAVVHNGGFLGLPPVPHGDTLPERAPPGGERAAHPRDLLRPPRA